MSLRNDLPIVEDNVTQCEAAVVGGHAGCGRLGIYCTRSTIATRYSSGNEEERGKSQEYGLIG